MCESRVGKRVEVTYSSCTPLTDTAWCARALVTGRMWVKVVPEMLLWRGGWLEGCGSRGVVQGYAVAHSLMVRPCQCPKVVRGVEEREEGGTGDVVEWEDERQTIDGYDGRLLVCDPHCRSIRSIPGTHPRTRRCISAFHTPNQDDATRPRCQQGIHPHILHIHHHHVTGNNKSIVGSTSPPSPSDLTPRQCKPPSTVRARSRGPMGIRKTLRHNQQGSVPRPPLPLAQPPSLTLI